MFVCDPNGPLQGGSVTATASAIASASATAFASAIASVTVQCYAGMLLTFLPVHVHKLTVHTFTSPCPYNVIM